MNFAIRLKQGDGSRCLAHADSVDKAGNLWGEAREMVRRGGGEPHDVTIVGLTDKCTIEGCQQGKKHVAIERLK